VYPLLAAGEPGVRQMLELFRQQIDEALAFLGVQSVHELDPTYLAIPPHWRLPTAGQTRDERSLEAALSPSARE
jgi:hypothetical protein